VRNPTDVPEISSQRVDDAIHDPIVDPIGDPIRRSDREPIDELIGSSARG